MMELRSMSSFGDLAQIETATKLDMPSWTENRRTERELSPLVNGNAKFVTYKETGELCHSDMSHVG